MRLIHFRTALPAITSTYNTNKSLNQHIQALQQSIRSSFHRNCRLHRLTRAQDRVSRLNTDRQPLMSVCNCKSLHGNVVYRYFKEPSQRRRDRRRRASILHRQIRASHHRRHARQQIKHTRRQNTRIAALNLTNSIAIPAIRFCSIERLMINGSMRQTRDPANRVSYQRRFWMSSFRLHRANSSNSLPQRRRRAPPLSRPLLHRLRLQRRLCLRRRRQQAAAQPKRRLCARFTVTSRASTEI